MEEELKGHTQAVQKLQFSEDGMILISTSRLYRVTHVSLSNDPISIQQQPNRVSRLAISQDLRQLATVSSHAINGSRIQLWDLNPGASKGQIPYIVDPIRQMAFSPNGNLLASVSRENGHVQICDPLSGQTGRKLEQSLRVFAIKFSHDSDNLACIIVAPDPALKLWNLKTGNLLDLEISEGDFDSLEFSIDDHYLVYVSQRSSTKIGQRFTHVLVYTVQVWNCSQRRLVFECQESGCVSAVAMSMDNRQLAYTLKGPIYYEIAVINLTDAVSEDASQRIISGIPTNDRIMAMAFSPDSKHIALVSSQKCVYIYEAISGDIVHNIDLGCLGSIANNPPFDYIHSMRYLEGRILIEAVMANLEIQLTPKPLSIATPKWLSQDGWICLGNWKALREPLNLPYDAARRVSHGHTVAMADYMGNICFFHFDPSLLPEGVNEREEVPL